MNEIGRDHRLISAIKEQKIFLFITFVYWNEPKANIKLYLKARPTFIVCWSELGKLVTYKTNILLTILVESNMLQ